MSNIETVLFAFSYSCTATNSFLYYYIVISDMVVQYNSQSNVGVTFVWLTVSLTIWYTYNMYIHAHTHNMGQYFPWSIISYWKTTRHFLYFIMPAYTSIHTNVPSEWLALVSARKRRSMDVCRFRLRTQLWRASTWSVTDKVTFHVTCSPTWSATILCLCRLRTNMHRRSGVCRGLPWWLRTQMRLLHFAQLIFASLLLFSFRIGNWTNNMNYLLSGERIEHFRILKQAFDTTELECKHTMTMGVALRFFTLPITGYIYFFIYFHLRS